jgi:hypothetical protein
MDGGHDELRLGATLEAGWCRGRVKLGRVAEVLVNARSVAPNRRATRRRLAFGRGVVDMKTELEFVALEKLLLCPNKALKQKSRRWLQARPYAYMELPRSTWPSFPRLMLNACRSA